MPLGKFKIKLFPGGTYIPPNVRCYKHKEDAIDICNMYNDNPEYYKPRWEAEKQGRAQPIRDYDLWAIFWEDNSEEVKENEWGEIAP